MVLSMKIKEIEYEYKTEFVGFRVTPREYELLLKKFGTWAELRDFILELVNNEGLKHEEHE